MSRDLTPAVDPVTHCGAITSLSAATGNPYFASLGTDARLRVWALDGSTPHWTITARPGPSGATGLVAAALRPESAELAVAVIDPDRADGPPEPSAVPCLLWICDIERRTIRRTYRWPQPIRALAFDPSGDLLAVVATEEVRLIDVRTSEFGDPDSALPPPTDAPAAELRTPASSVAVAAVGASIRCVVGSASGVRAFDLQGDALVERPFALRPDSGVASGSDGTTRPTEPRRGPGGGGNLARLAAPHVPAVEALAVAIERMAIVRRDGSVLVADLDGSLARVVSDAGGGRAGSVALTEDGRRLVVGARAGTNSVVTVHDLTNFALIGARLYDADAPAVAFLHADTVVSAGGTRVWMDRWAATSFPGDDVARLDRPDMMIAGAGRLVDGVAVRENSIVFGRGGDPQSIRTFDLDALALVDSDHKGGVPELHPVAVSDRWLVEVRDDQVIRVWSQHDHSTGTAASLPPPSGSPPPTLSLFVTNRDEWVVFSRSGYYAASVDGDRFLALHLDRGPTAVPTVYAADRLEQHFYRPDVVRALVASGSESDALTNLDVRTFDAETNLPPEIVDVAVVEEGDAAHVRFATLDVGGPPATHLAVVHNGLPVWEAGPTTAEDQPHDTWVWLDPGTNEIRIVAESPVAKATPVVLTLTQPGDDTFEPAEWAELATREERPGWHVEVGAPEYALAAADEMPAEYVELTDHAGPFEYVELTEHAGPVEYVETSEPVVHVTAAAAPEEFVEAIEVSDIDSIAPVHHRRSSIRIEVDTAGSDDVELVARRNEKEVWRADITAPLAVPVTIDVPLVDGANELEITATARGSTWVVAASGHTAGPVVATGDHTADQTAPRDAVPVIDDDDIPPPEIDESSRGASPSGPVERASAPVPSTGRPGRPPRPHEERPHLFLVSIGVSDLAHDDGPLNDLRYAADDALEIGSRFSAGRSNAFANVWRRVLVDGAATKAGIETALAELRRAVEARTADKLQRNVRSRDVVLLFFAGHGITHRATPHTPPTSSVGPSSSSDAPPRDRFFMVAHDHDDSRVEATAVDFELIGRTLSPLNAEVIVLIDACRSGAALPGLYEHSTPVELARQLRLERDRTLYIVTATTSDERAWEHELLVPYQRTGQPRTRVGHGFFTHAILKRIDEADAAGQPLSLMSLIGAVQDQLKYWTDRDGWRHVRQRPKARIEGEQIPRLEVYTQRRTP